jgi:uncharacterized phage protein (TIGR01671 family)
MREILFRGKDCITGKWVEGGISRYGEGTHVYIIDFSTPVVKYINVVPETVGEYTGLKDRDGKRIFEGDVVKIDNGADEETIIGFVVYEYASWQIDCGPDFISLWTLKWRHLDELKEYQSVEIIGNIHDAPGLLGRKTNNA